MRLIFFGSSNFSIPVLEALVQNHEVLAVITQPDRPKGRGLKVQPTPVKEWAKKRGLNVFGPEKLEGEFIKALLAFMPEAIVVASYGKLIPKSILDLPPFGCLNVHPSLLPKLRGAAPIQWAILKGKKETGVTIFIMDEGLDSGPILLQRKTAIGEEETAPELERRLSELGASLTIEALELLKKGEIKPVPQRDEEACYAPKLSREIGLIDWSNPSKKIKDMVRGLEPWPCAYTFYKGKTLKVWKAFYKEGKGEPGEVIGLREGIEVACGEGVLVIKELQLEGKRKMTAEEFLRGYKLNIGEKLGR